MATPPALWTIGHSNLKLARFIELLLLDEIDFLLDVRSYPYSRFAWFNREELQDAITEHGISYVFLGGALGGRPRNDRYYDAEGHALYDRMAREPDFQHAIGRVLRGARDHRLALMCSCGQPRGCHRRLLVGKVLCEHGAELRHILPDGRVENERTVELGINREQHPLFAEDTQWRSARSVSHRRRLSISSPG